MQTRKKSGVPLEEDFSNAMYLHSLSGLCSHLNKKRESSMHLHLNETILAQITFKTICILDKYFGKHGQYCRHLVKFPASIFNDHVINGSLHSVLDVVLTKPLSFLDDLLIGSDAKIIEEGIQLMLLIENNLWERGFIRNPKIYFGSTVPQKLLSELRSIVSKHKGEIIKDESKATHIIEWDDEVDILPTEITEEFLRPIEFRYQDNIAKVHWWYHPDSYDEFIPLGEVDDPSDAPDAVFVPSQWRLCCRWIKDVNVFNEWGNEIDYEIDGRGENGTGKDSVMDEEEQQSSKRKRTNRGKRQSGGPRKDLMGTQVVPTSLQGTEKMMANMLPPSVDPNITVLRVVEVSTTGAELREELRGGGHKRKAEQVLESDAKRINIKPSGTAITACPAWFDGSTIHDMERVYMSEFFDGTCSHLTETLYLQMRSAMIDDYLSTPTLYLSATQCRKKLPGDVRAVLALHDFLDSHGIINFAVEAGARPTRGALVIPPTHAELRPNVNSASRPSNNSKFTKELTAKLLEAVGECDIGDWVTIARETGGGVTSTECLRYFASLSLGGETIPVIKHDMTEHTPEGNEAKRELLLEYINIRMQVVEDKIRMLRSVDALLDIEKDKVNIDKRDNQTAKAQIAVQQTQLMLK